MGYLAANGTEFSLAVEKHDPAFSLTSQGDVHGVPKHL
jgi:hypothetical protein